MLVLLDVFYKSQLKSTSQNFTLHWNKPLRTITCHNSIPIRLRPTSMLWNRRVNHWPHRIIFRLINQQIQINAAENCTPMVSSLKIDIHNPTCIFHVCLQVYMGSVFFLYIYESNILYSTHINPYRLLRVWHTAARPSSLAVWRISVGSLRPNISSIIWTP